MKNFFWGGCCYISIHSNTLKESLGVRLRSLGLRVGARYERGKGGGKRNTPIHLQLLVHMVKEEDDDDEE